MRSLLLIHPILCTTLLLLPVASTSHASEALLLTQVRLEPSSSEQVAREFIRQIEAENLTGVSDLLTDNVVLEQPYQLPGMPNRYEGKSAVQGFFQRVNQTFSKIQFENLRVVVSEDQQTVTVEGQGNFIVAANGTPYQNDYIVVLEMREGKIAIVREYFNPLILAQTFNIDLTGGQ